MADSYKYCRNCTYGQAVCNGVYVMCNYFLETGKRRPCPGGDGCTVKQIGKKVGKWSYDNNILWKAADDYRKQMREERLQKIRRERQIKNLRIANCPECGKTFQTNSAKRIYCCDKCKNRAKSRAQYLRKKEGSTNANDKD